MTATMVLFLSAPSALAGLYSSDAAVVALAASLLPIAGFFQVMDGIQVVAAGALRGIGDTRMPMVLNLLGFWLAGLPVGVYLAFEEGMGPQGLWWGLALGLLVVAVLLVLRIRSRMRGSLDRLEVDEDDA